MPPAPLVTRIPGLRSPYDAVGGIVHFGRMLDKIRLHAAGNLPPAWREARGAPWGFDGLCCVFLHVNYAELEAATLRGGSDEDLLAWAFEHGYEPSEHEIEVWNAYMMKRGWQDKYTDRLRFRLAEGGWPADAAQTMFDFIELDEGRTPRLTR